MKTIKLDIYTVYQADEDPLAVVLDGLVIDSQVTLRSYQNFEIAWGRMTPYQKKEHGLRLCEGFFREQGHLIYERMMVVTKKKEKGWLKKYIRKVLSI